MYDVITFGSAIQDIYIKPEKYKILGSAKFATGKGICFNLGSKIEIEDMQFFSGGGGTNTAATFAKQGLITAFCGAVGIDTSGIALTDELSRLNIDLRFVKRISEKPTSHSIVLSGLKEDRTIFVFRGASDLLAKEDIALQDMRETKWFYLAPLSGKLCDHFEDIVNFAKENNIKVAVNPGICQLSLPKAKLKNIFKKIDILFLNKEEASFLTKTPFKKEKLIFKKLDKLCPGIAVMTKGKEGVVVSDGEFIYSAKALKTEVADTVGAGDSFGSGFISGFIKENGNIEYAIQLAMANSARCLSKMGAKNGLLKNGEEFEKVKVEKIKTKK
jgi:sugar/nucleoside kinase (ribokinase family)